VDFILTVHSIVRWPVIALVVVGIVQALSPRGSAGGRRAVASAFVGLLDLQVLLGVILLTRAGALTTTWRHVLFMFAAAVCAHVFHVRARKAAAPVRRDRVLLFGLPLVLILFGLLQVL
jgi:hypothetical protein